MDAIRDIPSHVAALITTVSARCATICCSSMSPVIVVVGLPYNWLLLPLMRFLSPLFPLTKTPSMASSSSVGPLVLNFTATLN